jgi:hypothetical protein
LPTDTERRLAKLLSFLLFGGGVVAQRLVAEMYVHRNDIAIGEGQATPPSILSGDPGNSGKAIRRKVSKANKAVKHAMGLLKAGSKRATGADKGKLPKGAFLTSVRAAGLANPRTPSKIGKGKGKVKALARKIRKWW